MNPFDFILFFVGLFFLPVGIALAKGLSLYASVNECEACVFTLFGKVIGTIDAPGFYFLPARFGPKVLLVVPFGRQYVVSTALDQAYLRNQMVNSSEGTPMGIGIWYENRVTNPEAYLFANSNPKASLASNVANSTVSTLSNLEMETMLEDRHALSRAVRERVSSVSLEWGFALGSVYIRKVAFTDAGMCGEITAKVVNRLRQVTATIRQDGENRVSLIAAEAKRKASEQLAIADALRPQIVGAVLAELSDETETDYATRTTTFMQKLLELDAIVDSPGKVILVSPELKNTQLLTQVG